MKNDILKTIQNKLNSLIIDDDDSSVIYGKSHIDNSLDIDNINSDFASFIKNHDYNSAADFINTYGTIISYKPASLDDVSNIFHFMSGRNDLQYNDFSCLDVSDFIYLIDQSGNHVSVNDYTKNCIFIVISSSLSSQTDSDIIIYLQDNHRISPDKLKWQTIDQEIKTESVSGYKNTHKLASANKSYDIPAAAYCISQSVTVDSGNTYKGYLPSLQQFHTLLSALQPVNFYLKTFNLNPLDISSSPQFWWTSTTSVSDNAYVWGFCGGQSDGWNVKWKSGYVLPLFKKI